MMTDDRLTLCSVSFHSANCLSLNWELAQALNAHRRPQWVVAENTPTGGALRLGSAESRFHVVAGVVLEPGRASAVSYQHAEALANALQRVRTRYVAILDPDFYIVQPNWMTEIPKHMQARGLALFGVPWHPKWLRKYRYFPCAHCLFVDLTKIGVDALDFRPFYESQSGDQMQRGAGEFRRRSIGVSRDTGYRIYRRFRSMRDMFECCLPVFRLAEDFRGPAWALTPLGRAVELFLPDNLCYLPRRSGSYVTRGFADYGWFDAAALGCEEFVWRDEPFGLHMRNWPRRKGERGEAAIDADLGELRRLLGNRFGRLA